MTYKQKLFTGGANLALFSATHLVKFIGGITEARFVILTDLNNV